MPTEPSGDVVSVGGEIDRVKVSLRFGGDDLDPDDVSTLLGCQPTTSYRKGDSLPSQRSDRIAHTGLWLLKGAESEGDLETQVSRLLDRIPAELTAWEALARFDGNIFCGLFLNDWNRGFSLSPELMQRLAERSLKSLPVFAQFYQQPGSGG